jgi:hypothetical protein
MPENRYTADASSEENLNGIDRDQLLSEIMQSEFPDDPVIQSGNLSNEITPQQVVDPESTSVTPKSKDLILSLRSKSGTVQVNPDLQGYTKYNLKRTVPGISEDELDELLDDEWDIYTTEELEDEAASENPMLTNPAADGLFLVNSEVDNSDFHDLYLSAGPQNLYAGVSSAADVFCVFYIDKGVARPIPNYQTLEVMLVERGLTYGNITEATADEIKDYDLLLDGKYDDPETEEYDEDITPQDEFQSRTMFDRANEWGPVIRFKSGYRPVPPFKRDPGDYIKPFGIGGQITGTNEDGTLTAQSTAEDETSIFADPLLASGLGIDFNERANLPPQQKYSPMAFAAQTWSEQLREKYEGKMVVTAWPKPYNDDTVINETDLIQADDLIYNIRLMTLGYWKQVTDPLVVKKYAYLNEFDISDYDENDPAKDSDATYGEVGLINLLIENGGITNVPAVGGDILNEEEPLWNAFSHIIEIDRLDMLEYNEFLNQYNNGGNPFDVDYLAPYEPPGSTTYYDQARYLELAQQAVLQAEFTAIKDQILEIWPEIYGKALNLQTVFASAPYDDIVQYVEKLLIRQQGSPLFKIFNSFDGQFKYMKKKRKKKKEKKANSYWPRVIKKTHRIRSNFTTSMRKDISRKFDWAPDGFSYPDWNKFDKSSDYYEQVENRIRDDRQEFLDRANQDDIDALRAELETWFAALPDIDNNIIAAETLEEIQGALDDVVELNTLIDNYVIAEEEAYMAQKILREDVDAYVKAMLKTQYDAVQFVRKKIHNRVGNRKKFLLKWPNGPKNILNKYYPGLKFDNYQ